MKHLKLFSATVLTCGMAISTVNAQTDAQRQKIKNNYNQVVLKNLGDSFKSEAQLKKQKAMQAAVINGWQTFLTNDDGSVDELMDVSPDGKPIYYSVHNVSAAKSTRADHLNIGGSLGLSLDGQNMTAYVWDGGATRISHQEFDGPGGNNRVSIKDGVTSLNSNSFHAQHVTGTIVASGVVAASKGMAPQAKAFTHDWNNDLSEATNQAANGMLLSNHSYGYRANLIPDWYFGAYIAESRDWDNLMYNSPYYLMVVAAGNDGSDNFSNGAPLNGNSSYDKLSGHSTSKNNIVVANGQDANVNADGSLNSVVINSGSSEGPTDDLRIKPDITGNGTSVYSTYDNADNAYNSISGTSMASPNVTGTLLLLQQHYNNLFGNFMRASTLKGLALHTADDAGITGPDAVYGWGLLNGKAAAEAITAAGNGAIIDELTLNSGQSYTVNVNADGTTPLMASISWTDLPGTANTGTANQSTPVLVNDLDVRITKGSNTYFPYKLTNVNSNTLGDNNVDPFERISVNNASGSYTITVTHKGNLSGGSQNFSLIVTGVSSTPVVCNATTPLNVNTTSVTANEATLSWDAVTAATYETRYRTVGGSWNSAATTSTTVTLSGLNPETAYEFQVRSKCDDGTTSAYSATTNFTTPEVVLNYCSANGESTSDEYISRVQLANLDKSSGASASGYSDFTASSASITKGIAQTITITPTWTGSKYNEGYGVWIDYNKDGDFDDANEQVFTQAASQNSPVSGNFTVPANSIEGNTRMRVAMRYNTTPSSCGSFNYGEVEDYTVTILPGDEQAPTAPLNLTAANVGETSLTLNWQASSDNVGVTAYNVFSGATKIATTSNTSYNVSGLNPGASYTFSVTAEDAAGNVSSSSNSVNVTMQQATIACNATATLPYAESFESGFGNWVNASGDDFDWTRNSGGTGSRNTGPSGAAQGSNYLYTESSSPNYNTKTAILESPCFDLTDEAIARLSFKYHLYGASTMGGLVLEVSADGNTWTQIWAQSGNKGNSWLTADVDLASYLGSKIKLRFVGTTGTTWQGDMAIDQISISNSVASSPVTVNLSITFDNYPEETSWEINQGGTVVASGGTYGNYADGSTFNTTVDLPEGCYDFVIRDSYGDGICCSYGNGSYSLTDNGTVLATGGNFAQSETTSFCVGNSGNSFVVSSIAEGTKDTYELYPNPVSGNVLNISTTNPNVSFVINDYTGRLVKQGLVFGNTIDLNGIPQGMYLINISDGVKTHTQKFIKQ